MYFPFHLLKVCCGSFTWQTFYVTFLRYFIGSLFLFLSLSLFFCSRSHSCSSPILIWHCYCRSCYFSLFSLLSLLDLIYLVRSIFCRLLNSSRSSSSSISNRKFEFFCILCISAALVWLQISSDLLTALCQLRIKSSKCVGMNWMLEKCSRPNQIPGNTPVWIKY